MKILHHTNSHALRDIDKVIGSHFMFSRTNNSTPPFLFCLTIRLNEHSTLATVTGRFTKRRHYKKTAGRLQKDGKYKEIQLP